MSKKLTNKQKENIKSVVKKWNTDANKSSSNLSKLVIGSTGANAGVGIIDLALFGGSFTAINGLHALLCGYFTKNELAKKDFTNSARQRVSARNLYKIILLEMDKKAEELVGEFEATLTPSDRKEAILKELKAIAEESNMLSPMFDIEAGILPDDKNDRYHFNSVALSRAVKKKNLKPNLDGFLIQEKNRKNMRSLNKNGFGT